VSEARTLVGVIGGGGMVIGTTDEEDYSIRGVMELAVEEPAAGVERCKKRIEEMKDGVSRSSNSSHSSNSSSSSSSRSGSMVVDLGGKW
jgi:hypothetical protein